MRCVTPAAQHNLVPGPPGATEPDSSQDLALLKPVGNCLGPRGGGGVPSRWEKSGYPAGRRGGITSRWEIWGYSEGGSSGGTEQAGKDEGTQQAGEVTVPAGNGQSNRMDKDMG